MSIFLGKPSQNVIDFIKSQYKKEAAFWLEAEEDGLTIEFSSAMGNPFLDSIHISVSRDGVNWTAYDGYLISDLKAGDKVYFRAGHPDDPDDFRNERMCVLNEEWQSVEDYLNFKFNDVKVGAHGNLNCLLKRDGEVDQLASSCYVYMFAYCTSLTAAPELPAQTLADDCYDYMFYNCTSLTAAPELPAQTLADDCYYGMFSGCTSLTTAPELPAQTLASSCYTSMFAYCTSLTAAPELPAQTLASYCYNSMFINCTSLKIREGGTEGTKVLDLPVGTTQQYGWSDDMFANTGGTFTRNPEIGKAYWCYQ